MSLERIKLIIELEQYFKKPVFLITYNYSTEPIKGFIEPGDEFHFRQFREEVLSGTSDCVFIWNGPGGNIKTAIACSQFMRDALIRYDCFVPTVASSSLCYFILQSDRLLLGEKSLLTQIDPLFIYEGKELRAIENLNNPNSEIRKLAKDVHNTTLENIKNILKTPPHVFKKEVSQESQSRVRYFEKMVQLWMKKDKHDKPLTIKDLMDLKVNFKEVPLEIINKAKQLIKLCQEELVEENKRFVIQTSKLEEGKYCGGYFYS